MPDVPASADLDVVIVGAGAAGLATAIFTKRRNPAARVAVLDGAQKPGAKILVSGGSRCNVTNAVVTERDFNGGKPTIVRNVLRALPVDKTVAFFREIGVALHEEPGGKLFPDSERSSTVLTALLREIDRAGVSLRTAHRVTRIARERERFRVDTSAGAVTTHAVVLATGGLSLPKTGSDGWGYDAAVALGHTIVPTTPALVPLLVDEAADAGMHRVLSGVAQPARLTLRIDARVAARIDGALLWTHFGISGPAALDMSRHWLRAKLNEEAAAMSVSLCPDETFETLERALTELARDRPRLLVRSAIAERLPDAVATAVVRLAGVPADATLAALSREQRRAVVRRLLEWTLAVTGSRGYNFAEVTAGGVALTEIDPSTMASRRCPGLYLVGEILDVDGRIGGFNFQWAWSSAAVAAAALAGRTAS